MLQSKYLAIVRSGIFAALVLVVHETKAQTVALPPITHPLAPVPYSWSSVIIRGGGFVSGLLFSPSLKGLIYARTDVGGAYRSTDGGAHWTALLDGIGPSESSYLGIESIAVDPNDANKLYLAAGMYSAAWGGPSAIFRSSDRGHTFQRTPMPFKMGGNDNGRGCGERLAVDPNQGSILYFGSRRAGLWRSSDAGMTWVHVDSFPAKDQLSGAGEGTGITFVLFDASKGQRGSATKRIYVGSAEQGAGLYRSDDAGATWRLVAGSPAGLFPNHAVLGRKDALYLSYNDSGGPNGIKDGAIWKFASEEGTWQDISPAKPDITTSHGFGFGGIAIDREHPETLMLTTIDRWNPEDTIFRSTDGGKTWRDIGSNAQASAPETPWVYWHRKRTGGRGWMNDIKIDPFDSSHVLYTTGEGIWGSLDVAASDAGKPTHWFFPDEGIEETVPLALISPPAGAHLLSAVGDLGGFRHEDLTQSPSDGFLTDPKLTTSTSIDFAAHAPLTMVRVGYGDGKVARGGYSIDGGLHWKPFASEPPDSEHGAGRVALAADGKTIVWSPDKAIPYVTRDWGGSWKRCAGLEENALVIADRVDPARFYSFKASTGQFFESIDGAQTFAVRTQAVADGGQHVVMAATPDRLGDLWIAAGGKVYHTSDAGDTFVPLEGMAKVSAIGFGMPAPGTQIPAIYISGKASTEEGTFRSTNEGRSWVRIDDVDHQFGWKNDVTGDPRLYGRVYLATGGRGIVQGEPVTTKKTPDASN